MIGSSAGLVLSSCCLHIKVSLEQDTEPQIAPEAAPPVCECMVSAHKELVSPCKGVTATSERMCVCKWVNTDLQFKAL